jgi:transketolase
MKEIIKKCNNLRLMVLENCYKYNNSHLSSCLSCVDIIGTLYFGGFHKNNDIILSKGHACITQATAMQMCGYKNVIFSEHPERDKNYTTTSGSLGFGIGVAIGIAIANRLLKNNRWVYCIAGDGELYEGLACEVINYIAYNDMPITIIIDHNNYSAENYISNVPILGNQLYNSSTHYVLYQKLIKKDKFIVFSTKKGLGLKSIYDSKLIHYIKADDNNIDKFRNELNNFTRELERHYEYTT